MPSSYMITKLQYINTLILSAVSSTHSDILSPLVCTVAVLVHGRVCEVFDTNRSVGVIVVMWKDV